MINSKNSERFEVGSRVQSRISGWYGTVTMSGTTIVQVKFDSVGDSLRPVRPVARFAKDLQRVK